MAEKLLVIDLLKQKKVPNPTRIHYKVSEEILSYIDTFTRQSYFYVPPFSEELGNKLGNTLEVFTIENFQYLLTRTTSGSISTYEIDKIRVTEEEFNNKLLDLNFFTQMPVEDILGEPLKFYEENKIQSNTTSKPIKVTGIVY